eukprot:scpid29544/ scgid30484/ 
MVVGTCPLAPGTAQDHISVYINRRNSTACWDCTVGLLCIHQLNTAYRVTMATATTFTIIKFHLLRAMWCTQREHAAAMVGPGAPSTNLLVSTSSRSGFDAMGMVFHTF